jgi:hypothetical protein
VLGYPSARVYDGGWLEYGHLLGAPVAGPQDGVVDDELTTAVDRTPPGPS